MKMMALPKDERRKTKDDNLSSNKRYVTTLNTRWVSHI